MNNKYSEAIGAFWGASVFLGALIAILLGFGGKSWLEAILVGVCCFLLVGLTVQGIITLMKKEDK